VIAGHYATALVPYELMRHKRRVPLWVFLVAAQFTDLLMVFLVQIGIEQLLPRDFLEMSFGHSSSDMWLSHDVLPALGWAVATGLAFGFITRDRVVGLWCGALVVLHEVCDLWVGYSHHWAGEGTGVVGLNLYQRAPVIGLLFETALCTVIIVWLLRRRAALGEHPSRRLALGLFVLLTGSTLLTLPLAWLPLSHWLGL
jgi:hypothetical protein